MVKNKSIPDRSFLSSHRFAFRYFSLIRRTAEKHNFHLVFQICGNFSILWCCGKMSGPFRLLDTLRLTALTRHFRLCGASSGHRLIWWGVMRYRFTMNPLLHRTILRKSGVCNRWPAGHNWPAKPFNVALANTLIFPHHA